jgi:RNA polymerase sigma-70 factor (ECF subfamily)
MLRCTIPVPPLHRATNASASLKTPRPANLGASASVVRAATALRVWASPRVAHSYNRAAKPVRAPTLASAQEISVFLADVERRAFKQAMFAVRDEDAALDIVQDAMLKLTEKYAAKPAGELPLLFQRILQNTIHDHFRRQKVRSTWTTLLSALGQKDDRDEEYDPLETLPARSDSNVAADPAAQLEQGQIVALIEQALARLPARQREAFLLRYWEELDVAETAAAMGCSEGSVKTHCSRAVRALAAMLSAKGITL